MSQPGEQPLRCALAAASKKEAPRRALVYGEDAEVEPGEETRAHSSAPGGPCAGEPALIASARAARSAAGSPAASSAATCTSSASCSRACRSALSSTSSIPDLVNTIATAGRQDSLFVPGLGDHRR